MESNISRDHIAMEAMKVILSKQVEVKRSRFNKNEEVVIPDPYEIAIDAYDFADAMIAERDRRNDQED